jgi:hypothetical protein
MTSLAVGGGGAATSLAAGGGASSLGLRTQSWGCGQTWGCELDSIASPKTSPHGSTINLYVEYRLVVCVYIYSGEVLA